MPTIGIQQSPTQLPITPTAINTPTVVPSTHLPALTPIIENQIIASRIERDITYCEIDGIPLKMDVYYPTQISALFPVVVNIHGGSWSGGDKSKSESAPDISELVHRGYVVAAVNYRLAPTWKFPAQIEDVKCAVRYLRAKATTYHIDPQRIGAWGCSAGGHLAALLGVTDKQDGFDAKGNFQNESSRVQAVAILSAPTDITLYDGVARADMLKRVFGVTAEITPALVRASPINYVSNDDPPLLILQADQDHVVSAKHGEKFYERLTAVGIPAQLITVKNAQHCFPAHPAMQPSREQISQAIGNFFDQQLKR